MKNFHWNLIGHADRFAFFLFLVFFVSKMFFLYFFLKLHLQNRHSLLRLHFHPSSYLSSIIINYTLSLFLVFTFDLSLKCFRCYFNSSVLIRSCDSFFYVFLSTNIRISFLFSIFIIPDGLCPFLHRLYDIVRQHTFWMHGWFPLLSFSFPNGRTIETLPPSISFHCKLWRIYLQDSRKRRIFLNLLNHFLKLFHFVLFFSSSFQSMQACGSKG